MLVLLSLLAVLVLAMGCEDRQIPECGDHGDCGELEACLEDSCQRVGCLDNSHCELQQYCDVADDAYVCVDGCTGDEDCPAGESCDLDSNSCDVAGCRNTVLDCGYGEICDPVSGSCTVDERAHCQFCDAMDTAFCPDDGLCVMDVDENSTCERDEDCADEQSCDELIDASYCHTDRCRYLCDLEDPNSCPRGWVCQAHPSQAEVYFCAADCHWLTQMGVIE